jgi:hypothetical protein
MKGPTAYMLFSEEQRPEVMGGLRAEAPDGKVSVTVVAKAIGELWKGLTEEQKAAYKEKAQQRAAGVFALPQGVCLHVLLRPIRTGSNRLQLKLCRTGD